MVGTKGKCQHPQNNVRKAVHKMMQPDKNIVPFNLKLSGILQNTEISAETQPFDAERVDIKKKTV